MARRLPGRLWPGLARRVLLASSLLLGGAAAAQEIKAEITDARYGAPTDRYPHAVLGDAIEWGSLEMVAGGQNFRVVLPEDRVFEDVAPRLIDVTGDGAPEVVVVESQRNTGAQLAIYDLTGKIGATPHIGTRNRWLAPVGAADMDGDGAIEIAYIDRPHLAKTLRVWRYRDGTLSEVASMPGLTNHRIGERDIGGGLRVCGDGVEMITASANWSRVVATSLQNGTLRSRDVGPHTGRASLSAAMVCD